MDARAVGRFLVRSGIASGVAVAGVLSAVIVPSPAIAIDAPSAFEREVIQKLDANKALLDGLIWRHDAQTKPMLDNIRDAVNQTKDYAYEADVYAFQAKGKAADAEYWSQVASTSANNALAGVNSVSGKVDTLQTKLNTVQGKAESASNYAGAASEGIGQVQSALSSATQAIAKVQSTASDTLSAATTAMNQSGSTWSAIPGIQRALETHSTILDGIRDVVVAVKSLIDGDQGNDAQLVELVQELADAQAAAEAEMIAHLEEIASELVDAAAAQEQLLGVAQGVHDLLGSGRSELCRNITHAMTETHCEPGIRDIERLRESLLEKLQGLINWFDGDSTRRDAKSDADYERKRVDLVGETGKLVDESRRASKQVADAVKELQSAGPGAGIVPMGGVAMPRMNAWIDSLQCVSSAIGGASGSCGGGPQIMISGVNVSPFAAGCDALPAESMSKLKSLIGAFLIIGAAFSAAKSIMAGISYRPAMGGSE